MSSFINDLLKVGLSRIYIIALGLGTSIITARYLGPENNGIIATLLVYPSLFMTIGSLGIRQSTTYFLGKGIYSEEKIKTAITQIWMFTSILSVAISFFLITYFSRSGGKTLWVVLALMPIPFSLFVTYNSGIFLGKNAIKEFNRVNWLPQLVVLILTTLFLIVFDFGVTGSMLALLGGPIIMFGIMLFKNDFIKAFSVYLEWHIIKAMLSLGVTYAIALLIINLNYRVDIIILDKLSTPFETGIYAKGSSITQYLWQIPMVLSTIVFSRSATSKDDQTFSHKVSQLLRLSLVLIGSMSLVLFLLSKFIIVTMYGSQFYESVNVLKILLPGVVILTLFKVMNMDLAGKGKPWISMKAMLPALFVNIVINIVVIPKYGANGAAFSSTLSYSVAGLLFLYFYSKEVKIPIKQIITYRKDDFTPITGLILKILKK